MEYPARIELALALLQSAALPLGYGYEIGVVSPTVSSANRGFTAPYRSVVCVNAYKMVAGGRIELPTPTFSV